MTDNEIIKTFDKWVAYIGSMKKVKIKETEELQFFIDLENARQLLNRLQAENERLDKEVDRLSQVFLYNDGVTEMKVEEAKAEAYKECIEKVKEKSNKSELVCSGALVRTDYTITKDDLDSLLKELVGENK